MVALLHRNESRRRGQLARAKGDLRSWLASSWCGDDAALVPHALAAGWFALVRIRAAAAGSAAAGVVCGVATLQLLTSRFPAKLLAPVPAVCAVLCALLSFVLSLWLRKQRRVLTFKTAHLSSIFDFDARRNFRIRHCGRLSVSGVLDTELHRHLSQRLDQAGCELAETLRQDGFKGTVDELAEIVTLLHVRRAA